MCKFVPAFEQFVVLFFVAFSLVVNLCKCNTNCGDVFLTVSPLRDTNLELNWITNCDDSKQLPDKIVLLDKDPHDRGELPRPLAEVPRSSLLDGYFRSQVSFGHPWLPGGWEYNETGIVELGPHCFPYWIVAYKDNALYKTQCLKIEPTWMNDHRTDLENMRINNMFIPGTHNSGSYKGVHRIFRNFVLNQDRSVWTQLVSGIRYLDFRVGRYLSGSVRMFWINHDMVRVTPLQPILEEIRKFARAAPKEIIILDFHRFPYPASFGATEHKYLTDLLQEELGDHIYPRAISSRPTLKEIWESNKTILVCYNDKNAILEYPWLWPPLEQKWGNQREVYGLRSYLSNAIAQRRYASFESEVKSVLWALMAELTPSTSDILLQANSGSLPILANKVSRNLTVWFRDEWAKDVNIVATDFYMANDLIDVAIKTNLKKASKM